MFSCRLRHEEYHIEDRPVDPISGGAIAFLGSFGDVFYETFNLPVQLAKGILNVPTKVAKIPNILSETEISSREISSSSQNSSLVVRTLIQDQEKEDVLESPSTRSLDVLTTTGKGLGRLTKAGLATPLHFTLGIARGFQNIPIAYGDTMVRKPEKVQGVVSGIKVGSKVTSTHPQLRKWNH
jgi:hypothetical protein